MDAWLDAIGLYRKNTALDGTCLFRAVAEFLLPANPYNGHIILRRQCCDFMKRNSHLYEDKTCYAFDEYMAALAMPKGWGSVLELDALSRIHQVDFLVYFGPGEPIDVSKHGYTKKITLCVTGESYYDSVYPKDYIQHLGFCQSIIYNILYSKVFKLKNVEYAVDTMLHDKAARGKREKYLSELGCGRDKLPFDPLLDEPDETVNVKEVLDAGAILFPYKVAKALDPEMYRNVDYDTWLEAHRGKPLPKLCMCSNWKTVTRKSNIWSQIGGSLRVGCMCNVRFDGRIMKGHIYELSPDHGPATVYIEELNQKKMVAYDDLIPLPRSAPKNDWSYAQKTQMINSFSLRKADSSPDKRKSRGRRNDDCSNSQIMESTAVSDSSTVDLDGSVAGTPPACKVLINSPLGSWAVVNRTAQMSVSDDYSDLPLNDLPTLRYFYNMGIEYFHQGHYVAEQKGCVSPGDTHLAHVCQGVPLIQAPPQPPPHPLPMPVVPMTPPIFVDPAGFTLAPLTGPPMTPTSSPPFPAVVGMCHPPLPPTTGAPPNPLPAPPPVPMASISNQESQNRRDVKERRNTKFTKPPRFQRLEMANKTAQLRSADHIQVDEVSSSTSPAEIVGPVPVAVLSPGHYNPHPHVETEVPMSSEPVPMEVNYAEHPFPYLPIEQPAYFDPDGNYSPLYLYPFIAPY